MDKELQVLVLTHVVVAILVNRLCVARGKVLHDYTQGLLVLLHQLALVGVGDTTDAGRQNVVDRLLATILLNTYRAHSHSGAGAGGFACVEGLVVAAPVTMYEVEGGQTHDNGFFETRKEHAHEAYGGEVVDGAHFRFVAMKGNAEEIPSHLLTIAITQFGTHRALIDNVVAPNDEVLGADGDVILIVFFVFVERVVLVQVLNIWCGLVGRFITLRRIVRVGRVTLGQVDALVAVEDACTRLVIVGTSVVVVVVVGRVVVERVIDLCVDLPLHLLEEVGIGAKLAFLL